MIEMIVGPKLTRRAMMPFYALGVLLIGLLMLSGLFFIGRDLVRAVFP